MFFNHHTKLMMRIPLVWGIMETKQKHQTLNLIRNNQEYDLVTVTLTPHSWGFLSDLFWWPLLTSWQWGTWQHCMLTSYDHSDVSPDHCAPSPRPGVSQLRVADGPGCPGTAQASQAAACSPLRRFPLPCCLHNPLSTACIRVVIKKDA